MGFFKDALTFAYAMASWVMYSSYLLSVRQKNEPDSYRVAGAPLFIDGI
jgi:hypothetical protein